MDDFLRTNENSKIKVCFIAPYTYSLFNTSTNYVFGGSEVRAWLFGMGLAKSPEFSISFTVFDHRQQGIEVYNGVSVYADHYFNKILIESFDKITFLLNKIRFYIQGIISKESQSECDHLLGEVIEMRFKTYNEIDADIYCLFGASDYTATMIAYFKKNSKNTVLFLGSDSDLKSEYISDQDLRNEYGSSNRLCAYSLMNADIIISQSVKQQDKLISLFNRDSTVIKNPIDLDTNKVPNKRVSKNIVLWIGKSDSVKNPIAFVDLAKQNPLFSFLMIINKSNMEIHDQVHSQAPTNLSIIDYVSYHEVDKYFSESYLFVSTSIYEGFPNTFLQAGKYGVPVLSLNVDPDGYIMKHDCGFCANGDMKVLAIRLQMYFENHELYNRSSSNSLNYVRENHDIKEKVVQLGNEFKRIMSEKYD